MPYRLHPDGTISYNEQPLEFNPMEPLAIVFDAQTGVLHKHGSATRVNQWLEEMQEKIMARGINPLAMPFAIIYMPRTQSNLDHLNKAIGTTGYALNLIPPDPKSTRFH